MGTRERQVYAEETALGKVIQELAPGRSWASMMRFFSASWITYQFCQALESAVCARNMVTEEAYDDCGTDECLSRRTGRVSSRDALYT